MKTKIREVLPKITALSEAFDAAILSMSICIEKGDLITKFGFLLTELRFLREALDFSKDIVDEEKE